MKLILFLFVLSFSSFAFADGTVSGISGFFSSVMSFFESISDFIFVYIPSLITDFFVWVSAWIIKIKFTLMYNGLVFAHEVATTFLDLININSFVNSAISALPQDMKQLAVDFRFFESLTLVVEAWITRMVYQW